MKITKRRRKRYGGSLGGDIFIFVLLVLLGLFMIFPIYLSVIQSLKPVEELFLFPPRLYVQNITDQNFADLLATASNMWVPFSRYVFNSVFVAVVVTVAQLLFSSSAAYALSKVAFPGAKALNKIIEIALLFTSTVLYIMQYMVMATLGMINTYSALILPIIATSMGLYLMRQSMTTIPDAMIEAAKVDGAGLLRICWGIVMPNCKPALMTIIIFEFQTSWNQAGGGLVYDEALKTIPVVVQQIAAAGIARQGAIAASAVVLMIPPLLVFVLAQRNVMETMAHAGMKD
mgnify:CR=1 FL=1